MKKYVTARDGRLRPDYLDDEFVGKVESIMPHGSGINYEYQIVGTKDKFYVYNAYDYINDYGMYDKIFPFVVCFKNGEFAYLHFHDMKRSDYKTVEAYGFRDYLEELYWELEDKIKKILAVEEAI